MKRSLILLLILSLIVPVLFLGCSGDDGSTGLKGDKGDPGDPGLPGKDATAAAQPESCAICHGGNPEADGSDHQAIYAKYADTPTIAATINSVVSVDNGTAGFYNATMTFTITGTGALDGTGLPSFAQKRFYTVRWFPATGTWDNSVSFSTPTHLGGGVYTVTANGVPYALESGNGIAYLYLAKDELTSHGSIHLYDELVNAGKAYGDNTYATAAVVAGCEKCHGKPYAKHGYRMAKVTGLPDFAACKACHYDSRNGGHFEWQMMVDVPERWADLGNNPITTAERAYYAYKANVKNDTHMSHAMEFPYPQSMANCATCHEGNLDTVTGIFADKYFVAETCRSCHPVTGPVGGTDPKRAPALKTLWTNKNVLAFHNETLVCNGCHFTGNGTGAETFSQKHTGYDKAIYAAAGQKFSDAITVSLDNATLVGTDLTIGISANGAAGGLDSSDIVPAVLIGLYGYDTKDFIVNGHDRWDSNCNGTISRSDGDQPIGEYVFGEEVPGCTNPYWTVVSEAPGAWTIKAHLATWAGMIDNGTIKRVEIGVMPELENAGGELVPLNAVSRTFVLATGAFDDNFFGHNIVDVGKCNACHDQLATTFHSGDRGGSVTVCRMCHVGLAGGSHLEMQSRSIDSYVHAIHSFQAFDIGDVDFTDPVEALHYEEHIGFVYPYFTTLACESCHNAGKYNVPDQSKSLPGVFSAADNVTTMVRNISGVPSYIAGPASRACGSCHRARMINEDDAGRLAAFNSHTRTFGYLIEGGDILAVIAEIFSIL